MIDNDTEYKALKKLCRNESFQFTQKVPERIKKKWSKAPDTFSCPHWVLSEDYILAHPKSKLYWHTPGVFDGGLIFHAELGVDNRLSMQTIRDGIVEMGMTDHASLQLEPYRNRMIVIQLDADVIYDVHTDGGTGKINVSFFDDPDYVLWTVKYFDYIANRDAFVTVRARSANEAKVVAWYHSPWHQCQNEEKPIDPMYFDAVPYRPVQVLTRAGDKSTGLNDLSDAVMATQIAICEKYDKEHSDGSAA